MSESNPTEASDRHLDVRTRFYVQKAIEPYCELVRRLETELNILNGNFERVEQQARAAREVQAGFELYVQTGISSVCSTVQEHGTKLASFSATLNSLRDKLTHHRGQRRSEFDFTIRAIAAMGSAHKRESSKVAALLLKVVRQFAQANKSFMTLHNSWRVGDELGNMHVPPAGQAITQVVDDNEDIYVGSQQSLDINVDTILPDMIIHDHERKMVESDQGYPGLRYIDGMPYMSDTQTLELESTPLPCDHIIEQYTQEEVAEYAQHLTNVVYKFESTMDSSQRAEKATVDVLARMDENKRRLERALADLGSRVSHSLVAADRYGVQLDAFRKAVDNEEDTDVVEMSAVSEDAARVISIMKRDHTVITALRRLLLSALSLRPEAAVDYTHNSSFQDLHTDAMMEDSRDDVNGRTDQDAPEHRGGCEIETLEDELRRAGEFIDPYDHHGVPTLAEEMGVEAFSFPHQDACVEKRNPTLCPENPSATSPFDCEEREAMQSVMEIESPSPAKELSNVQAPMPAASVDHPSAEEKAFNVPTVEASASDRSDDSTHVLNASVAVEPVNLSPVYETRYSMPGSFPLANNTFGRGKGIDQVSGSMTSLSVRVTSTGNPRMRWARIAGHTIFVFGTLWLLFLKPLVAFIQLELISTSPDNVPLHFRRAIENSKVRSGFRPG